MNNEMLIAERARNIGDFLVGRLLPFRQKRQVGPFTFIDHMGPVQAGPGRYFDVDQHPHIGLSTLTYLLSGQIHHKDSTGADKIIGPGDVGFMTAGKGVTHAERTPEALRNGSEYFMHGYQVWVALPKDMEDIDPTFQFIPSSQLPVCQKDGLEIKIIAGKGFGMQSSLEVYSDLFMIDIYSKNLNNLQINGELNGEIGIVVVDGTVYSEEHKVQKGHMLISNTDDQCKLKIAPETRILLFGGEPLPEPRYLFWNFVSSNKEKLEKAKKDWEERRFPKVINDETFIPLP